MIGERLRSLLKEKGISQIELANYLGVHRNTVGDWLKGRMEPGAINAYKIADFLDCDPEWLIIGRKMERPHQGVAEPGQQYAERRQDYREPGMAELIKKALELPPKKRQTVIKMIDILKKEEL